MRRISLVILLAVLSSSCSLRYVKGPPKVRPGASLPMTTDCTTSSTMPIVDAILGLAYAYAIKETLDESDDFGSGHIAMFAFPVGMFGSSIQGFRRISACKEFLATPVAADTTGAMEALSWPTSWNSAPPLIPRPIPLTRNPTPAPSTARKK